MSYLAGDKALVAKLQRLKKTDAGAAIRKGTRAGAKIVLAEAKDTVPVKTGALKASLKVRALPRSRKWTGNIVREQVFYAGFVEYGTKHAKARHYMKQATDKVKQQAMTTALETMKNEIEVRLKKMSMDTSLQTKLVALASLPTEQNTISEDKSQPYIWFQRQTAEQDLDLDGTHGLTTTNYTIEVSGLDIDTVNTTADTLKSSLNGFYGIMAGTLVRGVFVFDCADDYIPRNTDQDAGNHVAAFVAKVIHV